MKTRKKVSSSCRTTSLAPRLLRKKSPPRWVSPRGRKVTEKELRAAGGPQSLSLSPGDEERVGRVSASNFVRVLNRTEMKTKPKSIYTAAALQSSCAKVDLKAVPATSADGRAPVVSHVRRWLKMAYKAKPEAAAEQDVIRWKQELLQLPQQQSQLRGRSAVVGAGGGKNAKGSVTALESVSQCRRAATPLQMVPGEKMMKTDRQLDYTSVHHDVDPCYNMVAGQMQNHAAAATAPGAMGSGAHTYAAHQHHYPVIPVEKQRGGHGILQVTPKIYPQHHGGTGASAKMEEFLRSENRWFDLNIFQDYVRAWSVDLARDEIVQNWHDECLATCRVANFKPEVRLDGPGRFVCFALDENGHLRGKAGVLDFSCTANGPRYGSSTNYANNSSGAGGYNYNDYSSGAGQNNIKHGGHQMNHGASQSQTSSGMLFCVNYNSILSPRCLTAGLTGEEKRSTTTRGIKGKFGDGLQSAVNVLAKRPNGSGLSLISVGYRYDFQTKQKENCQTVQTLHYTIRPLDPEGDDDDKAILFDWTVVQSPLEWQQYCRDQLDVDFSKDTIAAVTNVCFDYAGEICPGKWDHRDKLPLHIDPSRYIFVLGEDYKKLRPLLIPRSREEPRWNRYEILLDPRLRGRIYVKGMLVMSPREGPGSGHWNNNHSWYNSTNASGNSCGAMGYNSASLQQSSNGIPTGVRHGNLCYGYNLLEYDIRSRDRFGSLTRQEETAEVIAAWHEVLNFIELQGNKGANSVNTSAANQAHFADQAHEMLRTIRAALFFGLYQNPDSLEATALRQCSDDKGDIIRTHLVEFIRKSWPYAEPCPYGNKDRKLLIQKLGRKQLPVPPVLYDLLAPKLPDLESEWEKTKAQNLRKCPVDDTAFGKWWRDLLTPAVQQFFKKRREFVGCDESQTRVRVVWGQAPGFIREPCCVQAREITRFEIRGFEFRKDLNGVYEVNNDKQADGRPTFWQKGGGGGGGHSTHAHAASASYATGAAPGFSAPPPSTNTWHSSSSTSAGNYFLHCDGNDVYLNTKDKYKKISQYRHNAPFAKFRSRGGRHDWWCDSSGGQGVWEERQLAATDMRPVNVVVKPLAPLGQVYAPTVIVNSASFMRDHYNMGTSSTDFFSYQNFLLVIARAISKDLQRQRWSVTEETETELRNAFSMAQDDTDEVEVLEGVLLAEDNEDGDEGYAAEEAGAAANEGRANLLDQVANLPCAQLYQSGNSREAVDQGAGTGGGNISRSGNTNVVKKITSNTSNSTCASTTAGVAGGGAAGRRTIIYDDGGAANDADGWRTVPPKRAVRKMTGQGGGPATGAPGPGTTTAAPGASDAPPFQFTTTTIITQQHAQLPPPDMPPPGVPLPSVPTSSLGTAAGSGAQHRDTSSEAGMLKAIEDYVRGYYSLIGMGTAGKSSSSKEGDVERGFFAGIASAALDYGKKLLLLTTNTGVVESAMQKSKAYLGEKVLDLIISLEAFSSAASDPAVTCVSAQRTELVRRGLLGLASGATSADLHQWQSKMAEAGQAISAAGGAVDDLLSKFRGKLTSVFVLDPLTGASGSVVNLARKYLKGANSLATLLPGAEFHPLGAVGASRGGSGTGTGSSTSQTTAAAAATRTATSSSSSGSKQRTKQHDNQKMKPAPDDADIAIGAQFELPNMSKLLNRIRATGGRKEARQAEEDLPDHLRRCQVGAQHDNAQPAAPKLLKKKERLRKQREDDELALLEAEGTAAEAASNRVEEFLRAAKAAYGKAKKLDFDRLPTAQANYMSLARAANCAVDPGLGHLVSSGQEYEPNPYLRGDNCNNGPDHHAGSRSGCTTSGQSEAVDEQLHGGDHDNQLHGPSLLERIIDGAESLEAGAVESHRNELEFRRRFSKTPLELDPTTYKKKDGSRVQFLDWMEKSFLPNVPELHNAKELRKVNNPVTMVAYLQKTLRGMPGSGGELFWKHYKAIHVGRGSSTIMGTRTSEQKYVDEFELDANELVRLVTLRDLLAEGACEGMWHKGM
eukprot:g11374.t1